MVNPNSGDGEGKKFFLLHESYLVAETDPENMDEQLVEFLQPGDHLLIAGGDGTISHVINGLYRTRLYETVSVSFFPLGTGNDLAKSLNIKKKLVKNFSLKNKKYSEVSLNLWKFNQHIFINYLSFGIDAKCLSDVTHWRRYLPSIRWVNLMLYGFSGVKNLFYRKKNINVLKGKETFLNEKIVSLVFSNINYYGGGCPLLLDQSSDKPSLNVIVVKTYKQWLRLMLSHFTQKPSLTQSMVTPCVIDTVCLAQADGEMLSLSEGMIEYAGKLKVILIN